MKVRIGFGLGTTAAAGMDGPTFYRVIDALESQRWDSVWFSERITGDLLDPLAAMAATAARTRRLKFGMSVLVVPGRNPVLLAKELATIDVLSAGRLVAAFGLGAGFPGEREATGVPRGQRVSYTEEATELIRRLWLEDDVTHEGRHFSVHGLSLRPKPVQDDPTIDIWFGGHSRPAVSRVGRIGDGWLPSFIAPAEYAPLADEVRKIAADAGRQIEEEHYGALVAYLPSEDAPGAEELLALVAKRRPEADPTQLVVTDGHEGLRRRLEAFIAQGASKFVVVPAVRPADWVEELAKLRETVVEPLEN